MQRRTTIVTLALISSTSLIAACGSSGSSSGSGGSSGGSGGNSSKSSGSNNSSQTPAAELTSAVTGLGSASTLTTSIKLGASASAITAIAAGSSTKLTPSEADAIAGASINIEFAAPSGKTISDLSGASASGAAVNFTVSDNGTDFISFREVNKTLYIQVDAKDLLTAIGKGSLYSEIGGATASLPPFVQALLQGKWVSLPSSTLKSLEGAAGASAVPSPGSAAESQFVATLKNIVATDVTVTRASSGGTDNLTLTANARKVATDLLAGLKTAVPSAGAALGAANPDNVPSTTVTLGAQVTGGSLSQLSIDLGQFDKKKKINFPLDINFSKSGAPITAPAGAVAVDTKELSGLLGSFAGGLGGTTG